jgi:hypothetical protein
MDDASSASLATIGERLLIDDHSSPVGYKVPSLPDFEIDPTIAITGWPCIPLAAELFFGVVLALSLGTVMIGLAFTTWDDYVHEVVEGTV